MAARQENGAKQPCESADGVVNQNDHPVRAYQRMPSAIFLDGTSTPPVPGGDYRYPNPTRPLLEHVTCSRLFDQSCCVTLKQKSLTHCLLRRRLDGRDIARMILVPLFE